MNPAAMVATSVRCSGVELRETDAGLADERAAEDFLQHRRRHADDADAGADVEAQHRPDQPELLGLVRIAQMHLMLGDHGLGLARRRPALRAPAGRRDAIAERADHHEHEVDRRHGEERLPHADRCGRPEIVHQQIGERRADHGAAAETHDGHAGRHAAAIREPFHQGRDRRDVAEAKPDAAEHAGADPQEPELMGDDTDGAEHQGRRTSTTPRRRRPCADRRARASRPRARRTSRAPRRTACTSSRGWRCASRRSW